MRANRKPALRRRLLRLHGPVCQLCGRIGFGDQESALQGETDPLYLTLGHLVPAHAGGHYTNDNTQLEHFSCNQIKGRMSQEEWDASWQAQALRSSKR